MIPHRQQIVAECQQRLTLSTRELVGLTLLSRGKFLFAYRQIRQRLVPASLQFAGHQPVLGVHRVVLTACTKRFVTGLLDCKRLMPDSFAA
jgi:hypothetical protein